MHAGLLIASSWCQQPCRRRDLVRVCVGCQFGAKKFCPAHEVVQRIVGHSDTVGLNPTLAYVQTLDLLEEYC